MTEQPMPSDIQACAFFLADHAVVENGKLYVNGGFWNQLYSSAYPVARTFGVAAVLHIPWHQHHKGHAFAVTFEDADGRPLSARFDGQFRVGTAPNMRVGDFTIMPVAAYATNFVLEHPGDYVALLEVDDVALARWRFRAVEAKEPMPGTQAGASSGPGQ
ncbi:MAG TPA: hypothetical protein VFQ44_14030 [Streptosporangiaceae bacterium]|nr:hypothetical protein [Streptosporangiaceae bacterium]